MTKKIVFKARNKRESLIQSRPTPASQHIPDWWRNQTPYDKNDQNPDGKKIKIYQNIPNATFKKCTPMLDGLTSGYIISLWADVLVEQTDTDPHITWKVSDPVFFQHGESARDIPAPKGYDQVVFKYNNTWIPKTPPGYSTLIISPIGYRDLPFYSIPAIIDTDKSQLEVVFPMWIKKKFSGIVENGTPMIQLIPFKRENWKSEFEYYEDGEFQISQEIGFHKTIVNNYVKNHWSKKSYK